MTIAQTILAQLGGTRFLAMTGARDLLNGGDALQFGLPANFAKDGINKVRVRLDASDTYTVTAYKFSRRTLQCPVIAEQGGVYADNLRAVFTDLTGLDTHL